MCASRIEPYPLPLHYRAELTKQILRIWHGGQCAIVAGVSGSGKSHFMRFLVRPDVRQHYSSPAPNDEVVVLIDLNALAELTAPAFLSLMGRRIYEELHQMVSNPAIDDPGVAPPALHDEDRTGSLEAGFKHLEDLLNHICVSQRRRLVLLLDEFDGVFRSLAPEMFHRLRALRDQFTYSIAYVLGTREELPRLRPNELETFVEIFTDNVFWLGTYDDGSASAVVERKANQFQLPLPSDLWLPIADSVGRHPGLIRTAISWLSQQPNRYPAVLSADRQLTHQQMEDFLEQFRLDVVQVPAVLEECRKLWSSLAPQEQDVLTRVAQSDGVLSRPVALQDRLIAKGLLALSNGSIQIRSAPMLSFIRQRPDAPTEVLRVADDGGIWLRGRLISGELGRLERQLLVVLYEHRKTFVTDYELRRVLYPDEPAPARGDPEDYRLTSLVKNLRKKIDPNPSQPELLVRVRGQGYRLMMDAGAISSGS